MVDYPNNAPAGTASRDEEQAFRAATPFTGSTIASQPSSSSSTDYAQTLAADRAMAQPAAAPPGPTKLAAGSAAAAPGGAQLAAVNWGKVNPAKLNERELGIIKGAATAAAAAGVTRLDIMAGLAGGHKSHFADKSGVGTQADLVGYTADGKLWNREQRVAVAMGGRLAGADRFGLYEQPDGSFDPMLHIGYSGSVVRPNGSVKALPAAAWGARGLTSGDASRAYRDPSERSFLASLGHPVPKVDIPNVGPMDVPGGAGTEKPATTGPFAPLAPVGKVATFRSQDTLTPADRAAAAPDAAGGNYPDPRVILAGGATWEQLRPEWQQRLQAEFGDQARAKYDAFRAGASGGNASRETPGRGPMGPTYAAGGDATLSDGGPELPSTGGADMGPASGGAPGAGAGEEVAGDPSAPQPGGQYLVQPGDNPWDIAVKVTGDPNTASKYATEIMRSNGIRDPRALQPGQMLRLPGGLEAGHVATPRPRPGAPSQPDPGRFASGGGDTQPPGFGTSSAGVGGGGGWPDARVDPSYGADGVDTMRGPDIQFDPGGGFSAPPGNRTMFISDDSRGPGTRGSTGTGQFRGGSGFDQLYSTAKDYARGLLDDDEGSGGEPPFAATSPSRVANNMLSRTPNMINDPNYAFQVDVGSDLQPAPAGPSGSNMTPAGRTYPDPAALAARERQLRMLAAQRQFDYAGGLR